MTIALLEAEKNHNILGHNIVDYLKTILKFFFLTITTLLTTMYINYY